MNLPRRQFFVILGAAAASGQELFAQHDHQGGAAAANFAGYTPRALSAAEYKLLDELAETLLPADETGPGAHDAYVAYYIDVVLTHGPAERCTVWRKGLAQIEALANQRFRQGFVSCAAPEREVLLAELAGNEMTPQSETDRFFVELKRTVIDGFYASDLIQREHLGYAGNTAIAEFAGCTHPHFEHPDVV